MKAVGRTFMENMNSRKTSNNLSEREEAYKHLHEIEVIEPPDWKEESSPFFPASSLHWALPQEPDQPPDWNQPLHFT